MVKFGSSLCANWTDLYLFELFKSIMKDLPKVIGCSKPHLCKVSNGYSICICLFISRFLPDDCCFSCFRIHTQDLVHFFLPTDVMTGDELVVDGGMVRFEVVEKVGPDVHCRCIDPDYALDV